MYRQMPSQRLRVSNSWAAYQIDNAMTFAAITIKNAIEERVNKGSEKAPKWEAKYTLDWILDPKNRLPGKTGKASETMEQRQQATRNLLQFMDKIAADPFSGGRTYRYIQPPPEHSS
jgi:hypothetical protein